MNRKIRHCKSSVFFGLIFLFSMGGAALGYGSPLTIHYEGNAQFELVSDGAPRVLIDVHDPEKLREPATGKDILLSTHTHMDHYFFPFASGFAGRSLEAREGSLILPDVTIHSLQSAHGPGMWGSNFIFIIDFEGFKVAHFGDFGQTELTPGQLKALEGIDIAIIVLESGMPKYFKMDPETNLRIMDHIHPRLVIPTHTDAELLSVAAKRWPTLYSENGTVSLPHDGLPAATHLLVLGENAVKFADVLTGLGASKAAW